MPTPVGLATMPTPARLQTMALHGSAWGNSNRAPTPVGLSTMGLRTMPTPVGLLTTPVPAGLSMSRTVLGRARINVGSLLS